MKVEKENINTNSEVVDDNSNETSLILKKYNLRKIIDDTLRLLNDNPKLISDIGLVSSCLLITINHNLHVVKRRDQKNKIDMLLTDLVFETYIDFLNRSSLDAEKVMEEIIKSSTVACSLCGFDFNVFRKLIDLYKLDLILKRSNKSNFVKNPPPADTKKSKLIWNDKGRLEELIFQLRKRKLIKTKLNFFNLFLDQFVDNAVVKWDFERKSHLAYLLHQLHAKDMVRLTTGKGYFAFAEMHFTGFDNTTLKKDSLKKLSSLMNSEPLKYKHIINEVDDIIKLTIPQ